MGDSAGGWFVAQLLVCLTKLALGEKIGLTGEEEVVGKVEGGGDEEVLKWKAIRRGMKKVILVSPVLELDMGSTDHPEDEEVQPNVSLSRLSITTTPKHRHSNPMPVSPILTHRLTLTDPLRPALCTYAGLLAELQIHSDIRQDLGLRALPRNAFCLLRPPLFRPSARRLKVHLT